MKQIEQHDETIPAFGYELLRNVLIPDLLGNEQASILYWAGKKLARNYPLESTEEIQTFFKQAGWGNLAVDTEGRNKISFSLNPETQSLNPKEMQEASYELEAGFLAQQIQMIKKRYADSRDSVRKKKTVSFTVEWDPKDPVD
ncbi:MAG TPA: YslB family protein [Bacillales bacterium]|nr:YslB family protein [Bacillales bacterium]